MEIMRDKLTAVDPIYINIPSGSKEHQQLKGCKKPTVNIKMIGLNYKFECGPTAREVLTVISGVVCGECLVDPVCKVVCSEYLDTYKSMVQWLNDNEHKYTAGELNYLGILDRIEGLVEQARR